MNRRNFLNTSLAAALAAAGPVRAQAHYPIGVTDWNLKLSANPKAVAMAKRCGFDGLQVALGRDLVDGKLALDNAELQQTYLAEAKTHAIALTSTCINRLHVNYLKNDPLGRRWVSDGIRITQALGLEVMLLPFFGKGAIEERGEQDYVADILREIAPEAEKAGVILGLEDTISARDNARIVERSRSSAVVTYYDIGNSTGKGFEVVEEIRWLGAARICEIHIKDNPHYLGKGSIDIVGVALALDEIGFDKWAVLETHSPSDDIEADMKQNLGFFRQTIARLSQVA